MKSKCTFAVVSAIYNVERYLVDFFESLDRQTYPHDLIRVILVDDGSTDGSAEACRRWEKETDLRVAVITQSNSGQGAARNAGIDVLDDESWVVFTDPDDFLQDDYFDRMASFVEKNPRSVLLSTHHVDYFENDPTRVDSHALNYRFASGDRLVDIEKYPRNFVMSIATSALKVDVLTSNGLKFDHRVRPVLEDAHLIARYLLLFERPFVGFVASAIYHYRRRGDETSTMQNAKVDPRRYTDVLEFGTRNLLESALETKGRIPEWLQFETIYDLLWIYRSEDSSNGVSESLDAETCDRFHELAGDCLRLLDPGVIDSYSDVRRTTAQREAMVHGYDHNSWHWEKVVVDETDYERGMVKLVYHFTGDQPREEIYVGGSLVQPRHAKIRNFVYLRKALISERILWVSAHGTLRIKLNGRSVELSSKWPSASLVYARPAQIARMRPSFVHRSAINNNKLSQASKRSVRKPKRSGPAKAQRKLEKLASARPVVRLFGGAWVLMDRSHNANDNAEHLFKYLRKHRRDINAWFVVKRGTADWRRLRNEGYKRIIPHGSLIWKLLCLNATHMISSHVDKYVVDPFPRPGGWKWYYIFLQHGVTKDNLSRWLNTKRIDALITASLREYESIAGDGSEYKFSTRETFLTGFPRHDRLADIAAESDVSQPRDRIVIMPTWRNYLSGSNLVGTSERLHNEEFKDTEFVRCWSELLNSSELESACSSNGVGVTFVPHPNLVQYLSDFMIPDWMTIATFETDDVQKLVARSVMLVTDFSSIAFDAAFVRRPVVYYQFDRDLVFGGGHIGKPGYFSYRDHGFGAVEESVSGVISEMLRVLENGGGVSEPYLSRMNDVFNLPSRGASARVTNVVECLGAPLSGSSQMRV